ncbi:MAG: hypothetical protein J6B46_08295 [Parabacteroides sp.]|nr:hypothetical protein [Parabacteroides sp.]
MNISRSLKIWILFAVGILTANAQNNDFEKVYNAFRQQTIKDYETFRDSVNVEYANFMRQVWKRYQVLPELPKPNEEPPVPPIIYSKEDKNKSIEDSPKPYDEVIPIPEPEPQPTPVTPIREQPQPEETYFKFSFFQTECKVRLNESHRFILNDCSLNTLADTWERLAGTEYNNVIRDCLELRIRYRFCDWAYLLMLRELSETYFGKGTNESTLFCAYLYCQSGYQMRLGLSNGRLYLLVASKHQIYESIYWEIDGMFYYPLNCQEQSLEICGASFPNERPLSLSVSESPLFMEQLSNSRVLQSKKYMEIKVKVSSDENLMKFFETYPTSMIDNNICTRWSFYANTPMSERIKKQLYPLLRKAIERKTQLEAVDELLNFVQTAFVYEYDDKVWGGDRAFFAEESLYYPYCDCEDRSILFSRLVRDLLGLKVLLVYYPGHLATAVCFTEQVTGDYVALNNRKYIICDPTYIGAPVGITMPGMDNQKAKVILLD